ncbi:MAG: proton-conducting transporter membrane subunit [Isosphaeraceae bacterium]
MPLISRLGDAALLAAVGAGLVDVEHPRPARAFLNAVSTAATEPGPEARAVGLLVVLAALTKSAQFPVHSWLPETMEAPTPVSALMHAGIINAGGALLLRFAPLLVRDPAALFLLTCVGTLTAALGMVAMWAQVKVKRTLAWSTVSQMGFMMVQFGLGAFPAAALHIVGHGCYKAWSFLRSGGLPASAPSYATVPPARALTLAAAGAAASIPAMLAASSLTGFSPAHSPGEMALAGVVALAMGQVWVALLGSGSSPSRAGLSTATTFAATAALFALYRGAAAFLSPVLGDLPSPSGPLAWASAVLPVATLAGLTVLHAFLPTLGRSESGRAFHVHALHGFYFGAAADRVVGWVWARRAA